MSDWPPNAPEQTAMASRINATKIANIPHPSQIGGSVFISVGVLCRGLEPRRVG